MAAGSAGGGGNGDSVFAIHIHTTNLATLQSFDDFMISCISDNVRPVSLQKGVYFRLKGNADGVFFK